MYPEPREEYKDNRAQVDLKKEISASDFYAIDPAQRDHYKGGCDDQHTTKDQGII